MPAPTRSPRTDALRASRIDLAPALRMKMVALLQRALADASALRMLAKHAHWNTTGPTFQQLHELYDALAAEVDVWTDDIAERARALGGAAPGSAHDVARATRLTPLRTTSGDHLEPIAMALASFGAMARDAIDAASDAGDQGTADLFTGISRACDKQLWFVESHLPR